MPVLQNHLRDEILWPLPPPEFALNGSSIHVWAASLDHPQPALAQFKSLLAPEELQRAARFHFQRDRNRFVAARSFLRAILGRYLQTDPAKIQFAYGPHGKPSLADSFTFHVSPGAFRVSLPLHFNLTHSESLALLALTQMGPIGIDVERIRPLEDADELVARFFSSRETTAYRELPPDQRPVAFFNLWTRKEAWLKATGEGIAHSLNQVEVCFLPGEPARLLRLPPPLPTTKEWGEGRGEGRSIVPRPAASLGTNWALHDLSPAPGFAAALANTGTHTRLNCWHWPEPASPDL